MYQLLNRVMALFSLRADCLSAWALFLVVLFLTGSPLYAQTSGNGSIYSRFGVGQLQNFSSSQSQALGGGGYALRSLNYNSAANLALLSDQIYTRLSLGADYNVVESENSSGQGSQLNTGSVEAAQFSFPLYKRKLGVGLFFQPFSQHRYRTQTPGNAAFGNTLSGNRQGTGGLYQFRGGLGYRINDILRVGAGADVLFGILERKRNNNSQTSDPDTDALRLSGVRGTVGAHLALADVFLDDDAFSIGAAVDLPTTLHGTRTLTQSGAQSVSSDTIATFDGDVRLPWKGQLGVAYQPNDRWTFTVDGLYEPWSTFSSSFSDRRKFEAVPVGGEEALTDRWRTSVGAEIVPAGDDQKYSDFLSNIAYRLGAYTEQLYIRPDAQTRIQTYAVTGGLSLPTALSGTRIDLNFRGGTRGTTSDGLVRDRFYGLSLHINFGEEWFQQRKLR